MRKIRILVVDDAVLARRQTRDALRDDPALDVVATASNGRIALEKIDELEPDLVTLSMDRGMSHSLDALAEIRRARAQLPIIVFSRHTARGAAATLDALAAGASDYVTKPSAGGDAAVVHERIHAELIPKIKRLGAPRAGAAARAASRDASPSHKPRGPRMEVVAIGVSTGGPNALAELLPALPNDLPVPLLVVQHMPQLFTALLAERLATKSAIHVGEASDGTVPRPGTAWLAPGGQHMIVERCGPNVRIRIHQGPPENSCRPSADVLFRSVARVYGSAALAVVLTGMGQDGLRGCEEIRRAGGRVLAQDEATSVVWGMPGFVANAGLADAVLPICGLRDEILRRVWQGRSAAWPDAPRQPGTLAELP